MSSSCSDELRKRAVDIMKRYHTIGQLDIWAGQEQTEQLLDAITNYVVAKVKESQDEH